MVVHKTVYANGLTQSGSLMSVWLLQGDDNDGFDEVTNDCNHVAKEAYIAAIIIGVMRLLSSLLLSKLLYHFKRRHLYLVSGKSNQHHYFNVFLSTVLEMASNL